MYQNKTLYIVAILTFTAGMLFQNCSSSSNLDLGQNPVLNTNNSSNGNPNLPPVINPAIPQVYAGHVTACYLKTGSLKCWGYNAWGQLGNGNSTQQNSPVQVTGMDSGVTSAAVGTNTTCAIRNRALYCWGINNYGQLGKGTTDGQANAAPSLVPGMDSGVTAVSVGYNVVCAIQNTALKCWGSNGYGGVGDGTNTNKYSPTQVLGLNLGVTAVAVSQQDQTDSGGVPFVTVCAIQSGALFCWGYNQYGQLGVGTSNGANQPQAVSGMDTSVTSVMTGGYSACAVRSGNLYCWGFNGNGELGVGDTVTRYAPTKVSALAGMSISQISAGRQHFSALANGKMYTWGWNAYGQVGNGNTSNVLSPTPLAGLDANMQFIAGSGYSTYAIQNNILLSWGGGDYGQLANGTTNGILAPTAVVDLSK